MYICKYVQIFIYNNFPNNLYSKFFNNTSLVYRCINVIISPIYPRHPLITAARSRVDGIAAQQLSERNPSRRNGSRQDHSDHRVDCVPHRE